MGIIIWLAGIVIIFLILEIVFFRYLKKRRKLSKHSISKIQHHLSLLSNLSLREQIFEYDKLLDFCLSERKLQGTLGEKMKRFGKNFCNENAIWQAHKLRNRLAHELSYEPRPEEYEQALRAFEREIKKFIAQ